VLSAILSDARHVPLDVAGLQGRVAEWWCEEQDDAVGATHEVLVDGRHGALSAYRVARRRHDAPGLGDRIDAACVVDGGAERGPIVEIRSPIPAAIPRFLFEGLLQSAHICAPPLGALALLASVSQVSPFGQNGVKEPPEPDALALPAHAHLVHPVVPITR